MRLATDQGFLFWHASGTLYTASGLLLQGKPEESLQLLQNGLVAYRVTGAELGLSYYLGLLADANIRMDQFAEASAVLDGAFRLVEKNDERFYEAELYRLKGELVLAESDDRSAAEEWFRRAIKTADRQQSQAWKLRATTSLARLWRKQGRREEAFKALRAAQTMFTEGFTTPDLTDAAALLESLAAERMQAEFAAGLKYVRDCIPSPMGGVVSVDWRYVPASTLGGDTIGYYWADSDHLVLYLIDVTGHGLDSALLSVSLTNVIRSGALSGTDMRRPDQVLAQLNDAFRGEQHGSRYFTIWYGVYNAATRNLTWAGGGHHPSVLLTPDEADPLVLASDGMMMGILRGQSYPARSCQIPVGARLFIFSDGVFEIFRDGKAMWSLADCVSHLKSLAQGQGALMDQLLEHVQRLRGSPHLEDDFSIIEARFG
jgi:tetratricopeptide (TPR) repeat protein